jgi:hypothetical protein
MARHRVVGSVEKPEPNNFYYLVFWTILLFAILLAYKKFGQIIKKFSIKFLVKIFRYNYGISEQHIN